MSHPKTYFIIGSLLLLMGGCSITNSIARQDHLDRLPRLTCDQLIKNGPPADGQVTLLDIKLCSKGPIATRFEGDLELYIPAYPVNLAQEPAPPDITFLFQIWGDDEWRRFKDKPAPVEFNCWATRHARLVDFCRGPAQIEPWVKNGIDAKYPGIRWDKLWVLTLGHGSTPTIERAQCGWRFGIGELLLGIAAIAFGAFLQWRQQTITLATRGKGKSPCSPPPPDQASSSPLSPSSAHSII